MRLSSLLKGVKTQDAYEERDIEGVTDKDNEIKDNTLFVCIDGNCCDGHCFAENVLKKGAAAVVTDRDLGLPRQIIVEDTRKALALIASNFYNKPSEKLKIIGITGTNGKTSTAFFVKAILESTGHSCGIIGTIKNDYKSGEYESTLTTPEPMELHGLLREMVNSGCEYCVMEVSSQALSQYRTYGIHFCGAALTNITPEHLDYHGNTENYINSKLRLFDYCDFACVNIDDENIFENIDKINCRYYSYSLYKNSADYTAKNVVCDKNGIRYEFVGTDCIARIKSKLYGEFNAYNIMCAASILIGLGFDADNIADAVKEFDFVSGRYEVVPVNTDFTVIIDYAHTPDGLYNILSSVRKITVGKIILLFGCGGDRDRSKRQEMGRIAGEYSDFAIVTSDNPRTENPLLIINDILCGMEKTKSGIAVIENRAQAIEFALSKAHKGDTVILAGKGHEAYQIIGKEKIPFNERTIIEEYFK